mmetsp:Transcript_13266/g.21016  ORF Transcript_13266/g.21016 Transcript_13266/m.21016 type:complete len:88 (-) Transcript_13266:47-310(-)
MQKTRNVANLFSCQYLANGPLYMFPVRARPMIIEIPTAAPHIDGSESAKAPMTKIYQMSKNQRGSKTDRQECAQNGTEQIACTAMMP